MKRRLIILRHGAAAYAAIGTPDRERALEERGRAQCLEVALELEGLGWVPDLALVSPARRTRESWAILAEHLSTKAKVEEHAVLYGAGWPGVCELLSVVDPEQRTVVIVGHNPGLEEVIIEATGFSFSLGTGNAALLAGAGRSWPGALNEGAWKLMGRIVPAA